MFGNRILHVLQELDLLLLIVFESLLIVVWVDPKVVERGLY